MRRQDADVIMLGSLGFKIESDRKVLHIGALANCGLYCNIGHNLYSLFAKLMNSNPSKRDHSVKFHDMASWVTHSADGVVLPYLFEDEEVQVDVPKDALIRLPEWGTNNLQKTTELAEVNNYFMQCFKTNNDILQNIKSFETKYNVDYANTLGVVFRGTDKHVECVLSSADEWIKQTREILRLNSSLRVLIQTDQEQYRDRFCEEFGDNCFFFEEVKATTTNTVIHYLTKKEEKLPQTKNMHTAVMMLARCKYLLNHAGNTGYAIATYRGTAENMWQFSAKGECVTPDILHNDKSKELTA